jgi:hypothetical protein
MSARVSLSTHTGPITHEEAIPVCNQDIAQSYDCQRPPLRHGIPAI